MKKSPARKGTIRRLIKFVFEEHKWQLVVVIATMIIATLMNVLAVSVIKNVVAVATEIVQTQTFDLSPVVVELAKMATFYLIGIIFTYIHLRIMINVGQRSLLRMRSELFSHMTTLPIKFFDQTQHGNLMSIFTNDINSTRQMISQSLPQLIVSSFTLIFYFIVMLTTSFILSFFALSLALVLLLTSKHITSSSRPFFIEQQMALGTLNGYVEEMVEGQKVVKLFRREKQVVEDFEVLNEKLTEQSKIANKRVRTLNPFTVSVGYFGYVIIAVVGGALITVNMLDVAALVLFLVLTRSFTGPFIRIANQMSFIGRAVAGADRVFRVIEQTSEVDQGTYEVVNAKLVNNELVKTNEETELLAWYNEKSKKLFKLRGDIRFNDVTFGYDKTPVLKNVSLYAKPGQKIAFVGATGAGKTTVANLINRFYDINEGEITFDGINILDIKKDCLRKVIAVVLQDTSLFTKTIKENISYGKQDATDEEIYEAAKNANVHELIKKLPKGYDTIISHDGDNLSQGQRQLLSIARAIASDRPVIILDEATSSVDTHTEVLIQDAMDELMKGRTVFVIAHRLSTIQNSDAIIVLEDGKIIERGDHDHLINYRGKYYELYLGLLEYE